MNAASLNNLAELYRGQGRYPEAERLYKRVLAILEKLPNGAADTRVATTLSNLALLYQAQRRYADEEPLYQRALAIREKALGPDHPDLAWLLNNLGGLYQVQGRYGDAERLFKRSLAIDVKALGPEHPKRRNRAQQSGRAVRSAGSLRRGRAALCSHCRHVREGVRLLTTPMSAERSIIWPGCISRKVTGQVLLSTGGGALVCSCAAPTAKRSERAVNFWGSSRRPTDLWRQRMVLTRN